MWAANDCQWLKLFLSYIQLAWHAAFQSCEAQWSPVTLNGEEQVICPWINSVNLTGLHFIFWLGQLAFTKILHVLQDVIGTKEIEEKGFAPPLQATQCCCHYFCLPLHCRSIVKLLPLSLIAIALVIVTHVSLTLFHPRYTTTAVSFLQFWLMTFHPPSVDPLQISACWKHHCCFSTFPQWKEFFFKVWWTCCTTLWVVMIWYGSAQKKNKA